MRKSERNLLAAVDAKIYQKVFELLNDVDDDVVVDLLVDILAALTYLTINASELKLFLRYLKTEDHVWVRIFSFVRSLETRFCLEKARG